jgi:hypothetical protein
MNLLQPEKENLKFKIGLSGTFWNRRPEYMILINGLSCKRGIIKEDCDQVEYIEFECAIKENSTFLLEIRLVNKQIEDTVMDNLGNIIKDMLLNIVSIEIDSIELEYLKWSASEYVPFDQSIASYKKCVNLGHNGSYRLEMSSPFYLWLLENM